MIVLILTVLGSFSLIVLGHEFGHFIAARRAGVRVDEFGFGFPPRLFGIRRGGTLFTLNLIPLGGFVKIAGEDGTGGEGSFSEKSALTRAGILAAGVAANLVLAWAALSLLFMVGVPQEVRVGRVLAESPAAVAGVLAGDILVEFTEPDEVVTFLASRGGEETQLRLRRNGAETAVTLVPRMEAKPGEGRIGIELIGEGVPASGAGASLVAGARRTASMLREILVGVYGIVVSGNTEAVGGPVAIVRAVGEASSMGFGHLLNIFALISLNLVIINLLPIPALDGGRLLFLGIEAIRGKPLPRRAEAVAHATGLAALLLIMLIVTIRDIYALF